VRRDEQGQVTLLIIGFASILLMAIVVVIDASAAYLQRQGLDNLADGAALYGADLGSAGIYEQGLDGERLTRRKPRSRPRSAIPRTLRRSREVPRHRRGRPRRPAQPVRHGPAQRPAPAAAAHPGIAPATRWWEPAARPR
jgi:hypothetical protein